MYSTKILILEDHGMTRQLIVVALKQLGYINIHTAGCSADAFDLLASEGHFDVLICDIRMGEIDGLTFLCGAAGIGKISSLIIFSVIASDLRQAVQQLAKLSGYNVLGNLDKTFTASDLKKLLLRYRPNIDFLPQIKSHEWPCAVEIKNSLRLSCGKFTPFYQPKINLKTLEVVGLEVLARWVHPQRGVLTPSYFLDAVQHFGFLNGMTKTIAREALSFLREQKLVGKLRLSLNLEMGQLAEPCLLKAVSDILKSERVPPQSVIFEITETGLMQAPITSIENIIRLRLIGCGISIDDFGVGFSSLQRVCDLPCGELKLDAGFIRSMTHNHRSLAAVDYLLRLSRELGIELVAEGIETLEQLSLLQKLNCPIGQGFALCPPLPGCELIEWLHQYKAVAHSA